MTKDIISLDNLKTVENGRKIFGIVIYTILGFVAFIMYFLS